MLALITGCAPVHVLNPYGHQTRCNGIMDCIDQTQNWDLNNPKIVDREVAGSGGQYSYYHLPGASYTVKTSGNTTTVTRTGNGTRR